MESHPETAGTGFEALRRAARPVVAARAAGPEGPAARLHAVAAMVAANE